jgi:hypothetical protein
MIYKLNPEDLVVASFDTYVASVSLSRYTPDCCTDDGSGCRTGPETGCNTDEHDCATVGTEENVEVG